MQRLLLLMLFFAFSNVSAGLLTALSKLGKSADNVDLPSVHKLELPGELKDLDTVELKPGPDGQWRVIGGDGVTVDLAGQEKSSVLLIREHHLPRELSELTVIPAQWPLLVQGRGKVPIAIERHDGLALRYGGVRLAVSDIRALRHGLWLLQRPVRGRIVSFHNMDEVSGSSLLETMEGMSNQTLVLAGRLGEVELAPLRRMAEARDLSLVILQSETPNKVIRRFRSEMQRMRGNVDGLHDTVGDLYNRLLDPNNPAPLQLSVSRSGEQQLAVQQLAPTVPASSSLPEPIALVLATRSVALVVPDRARSEELEARIIQGVSSWIQFYLLGSAVLGYLAIGTCWRLWGRVWGRRPRSEYRLWPGYALTRFVQGLLFMLLFIPLFGLPGFLWAVLTISYSLFHFLFVRPVRWLMN